VCDVNLEIDLVSQLRTILINSLHIPKQIKLSATKAVKRHSKKDPQELEKKLFLGGHFIPFVTDARIRGCIQTFPD
jgi:hypothetical protein